MMLKELIEREGVRLSKDGKYFVGISPFSRSRLPLLVVDDENQRFTDLGTGISGDAADFIANLKGISRESAERLVDQKTESEESEEEIVLKNICRDANEYFKEQIKTSKEAVDYLKSRGFNEEDINNFEFGYAPNYGNRLYKILLKTYKKEDILKSGLCKIDKSNKIADLFWKRLMIPIRNAEGDVVAFGGRVLDDGTPKYINTPETPIFKKRKLLYGYNTAKDTKCNAYIICEGYMDCITLHKEGFTNAVASLGTALTKDQCELLTNKKRVYVLYDTDIAGRNARNKAIPLLEKIGLETKVIDYSPYKDPDEFLKKEGREEFIERFKKSGSGEKELIRSLIQEDVKKAMAYLNPMSVDKIKWLTSESERRTI